MGDIIYIGRYMESG